MTNTLDKIISEYTALQLKVETLDEELTRTKDHYLAVLRRQEDRYETLRPHWAKGYSSDSVAAQAHLDATLELWKLLGVSAQTHAVARLKTFLGRKKKVLDTFHFSCIIATLV